jgi:CRISPR/Cas system-associated exonuclease Cas4 (RecB family)
MNEKQFADLLTEQLNSLLTLDASIARISPVRRMVKLELGAMGHECDRNLWYRFRNAVVSTTNHLQARSHHHSVNVRDMVFHFLRSAGMTISIAKQTFSIINDHFSGYSHGAVIVDGDELPVFIHVSGTGAKFNEISGGGVERARPDQHAQMCVLLAELGRARGLYIAYNKNDDSMYLEVVPEDSEVARKVEHRAKSIIYATQPPPRINESPAWYVCKSCPANAICHPETAEPVALKNCRSCTYAYPMPEGQWHCKYYNDIIPASFIDKGCEEAYTQIQL